MKMVLAAALGVAMCAGAANAAAVFAFTETGGDVVGQLSGSLDLTGATSTVPTGLSGNDFIVPSDAFIVATDDPSQDSEGYRIVGPSAFGSGGQTNGSYSGDNILLAGVSQTLYLSPGYTSGEALSGTLTFSGETLASLGVVPGAYVYSLPSDTLTVTFEAGNDGAVVPLPAGLPLLAGALGLFGLVRRRG